MVQSGRPETVRLLNYPVALGVVNRQHVDDWLREFQLMKVRYDAAQVEVDPRDRLRALVQDVTAKYEVETGEPRRRREEAAVRGIEAFDQEYPLRPDSESIVLALQEAAAAVDELCARAVLLTLPRPPIVVEFANWVVSEFVRQGRGEEPSPWTGRFTDPPLYLTESR